jgi:hypothetical protein
MPPLRNVFFASEPTFALPLHLSSTVPLADESARRLHTCLVLNRPHGVPLTPAEAATSTILLKADLYLQRLDLSLALLHTMMVAACFSLTVEPQTVSSLTDDVYRSSPLTSSLFGYPAHTYASAIGAAACVGYGVGLLPSSWPMSREFDLPMLQASPRTPVPSLDAFVDGGVTNLSQRDPTIVGSLTHATLYRGGGASSLPIPVRGASSAAFASAPGN